jgi:hypothetical protein
MSSKIEQNEESLMDMRAELVSGTIAARLKLLVLAQTPEKKRFPILEGLTDVSENTWRTWWKRGGTPSGTLVEGVGKAWPEYAFWLTTGLTDVEYGHRMPELHISVIGYVDNYPEVKLRNERTLAAEYFKVCKELQAAPHEGEGHQQRRQILENTRIFVASKRREQVCARLTVDIQPGNES